MAVCATAACAATSAAAPSNARIMVSSSGTPSLKDRGRGPDQSLMMLGKMKPTLMMHRASLRMNIAFCCGFISEYGVPVDLFGSMGVLSARLYAPGLAQAFQAPIWLLSRRRFRCVLLWFF